MRSSCGRRCSRGAFRLQLRVAVPRSPMHRSLAYLVGADALADIRTPSRRSGCCRRTSTSARRACSRSSARTPSCARSATTSCRGSADRNGSVGCSSRVSLVTTAARSSPSRIRSRRRWHDRRRPHRRPRRCPSRRLSSRPHPSRRPRRRRPRDRPCGPSAARAARPTRRRLGPSPGRPHRSFHRRRTRPSAPCASGERPTASARAATPSRATLSSTEPCVRRHTTSLTTQVLKNGGSARSTSTPAGLGSDSIAGAHLVLGEKASVKRSTVGKDCSIAKLAKIASCVLMDRVVVGEGCVARVLIALHLRVRGLPLSSRAGCGSLRHDDVAIRRCPPCMRVALPSAAASCCLAVFSAVS